MDGDRELRVHIYTTGGTTINSIRVEDGGRRGSIIRVTDWIAITMTLSTMYADSNKRFHDI
jgi:hypothetical protein